MGDLNYRMFYKVKAKLKLHGLLVFLAVSKTVLTWLISICCVVYVEIDMRSSYSFSFEICDMFMVTEWRRN